jgi:hypothetical protein
VAIHIIRSPASPQMVDTMLEALGSYIKLAVDVRRGVLAGGGIMHADCEAALLDDGSQEEDIWGADWDPSGRKLTFEALINIRPRHGNPSMRIIDNEIRASVSGVVAALLGVG